MLGCRKAQMHSITDTAAAAINSVRETEACSLGSIRRIHENAATVMSRVAARKRRQQKFSDVTMNPLTERNWSVSSAKAMATAAPTKTASSGMGTYEYRGLVIPPTMPIARDATMVKAM